MDRGPFPINVSNLRGEQMKNGLKIDGIARKALIKRSESEILKAKYKIAIHKKIIKEIKGGYLI